MKKNLIVIGIFLLSLNICRAQNGWSTKAVFPGTPRTNASGFKIGNDIYLGCGISIANGQFQSDFWKYNTINNLWTQIDSIPFTYGLGTASSFTINGRGYIIGGISDSSGQFYSPHVFEYDPSSTHWVKKNNVPFNPDVNISAFAVGNLGYLILPGLISNTIQIYNSSSDSWNIQNDSFASQVLWGVYGSTSISDSTNGYIFGGVGTSVSNCQWLDRFVSYDTNSSSWTFISPSLHIDSCYSKGFLFLIDSVFYFGTGTNDPNGIFSINNFYNNVSKYDLRNGTLSAITNFPYGPSAGCNYFNFEKCSYLICGNGGMNGNQTVMFCPDSITQIKENKSFSKISFSPNPFGESGNIQSQQPISKIIIYDTMLKSVLEIKNIYKNDLQVNLEFLKPGIYFVKFVYVTLGDCEIKKIIKI